MNKKLIDYLPPILREVREFNSILNSAEQTEFDEAAKFISSFADNHYISSAEEPALSRLEKIAGIEAKPEDTVNTRRLRLLSKQGGGEYTKNWLSDWLRTRTMTAPDFSLSGFTLKLRLPSDSDYEEIISELRECLPANISLSPVVCLTPAKMNYYAASALRVFVKRSLNCIPATDVPVPLSDETSSILIDETGIIVD